MSVSIPEFRDTDSSRFLGLDRFSGEYKVQTFLANPLRKWLGILRVGIVGTTSKRLVDINPCRCPPNRSPIKISTQSNHQTTSNHQTSLLYVDRLGLP